jgi:hypothetical protein
LRGNFYAAFVVINKPFRSYCRVADEEYGEYSVNRYEHSFIAIPPQMNFGFMHLKLLDFNCIPTSRFCQFVLETPSSDSSPSVKLVRHGFPDSKPYFEVLMKRGVHQKKGVAGICSRARTDQILT